jgi:hypothetical protein
VKWIYAQQLAGARETVKACEQRLKYVSEQQEVSARREDELINQLEAMNSKIGEESRQQVLSRLAQIQKTAENLFIASAAVRQALVVAVGMSSLTTVGTVVKRADQK